MERILNAHFWRLLGLWFIALFSFVVLNADSVVFTPPGPQLHPWISVSCASAIVACAFILVTARRRVWSLYVPAAVIFLAAAACFYIELEKAGTDLERVPDGRVFQFEMRLGHEIGERSEKANGRKFQVGDQLSQEPPDLGYAREGPYYERYKKDFERIGWRPTPTWTGDPKVVLVFTPKPIMWRRWFRVVPEAWVSLQGDGDCVTYEAAKELENALKADAQRRAELGLPAIPFEVYDR